ncbi:MAG: 50S ribosomal protein L24 [Candidatus Paceibacterota bacterium]
MKKGDTVKVITGEDKGKTGKILRFFPDLERVLVEGVNLKKHHEKKTKSNPKGQVIEKPFPIHISNVKATKEEKKQKVGKVKQ